MATGNAKRFTELGLPPRYAVELAAQITASTGNKARLMELGAGEAEAKIIAASVVSHTVNVNALAEAGMIPRHIREFNAQINS